MVAEIGPPLEMIALQLFQSVRPEEPDLLRHGIASRAEDVVPEQLAVSLEKSCPGMIIAGTYSPPFRSLTPAEDAHIVEMIHQAQPDVLWVGLSTPKQEKWMRDHRDRLRVPVLVGVGAAFDILSARKKQAPAWMREHGLEWLYRLIQEPRRLWKRYLVYGSEFLFLEALEILGLRRQN